MATMLANTQSGNSTINRSEIERIVRDVVTKQLGLRDGQPKPNPLVVNISARHVHLTDEHVRVLFGKAEFEPVKALYQDGFYAAKEAVAVVGPRM